MSYRAKVGRDSSVGIATRYGLDGPVIESGWGGLRFSAPIQTGRAAQPASCTIGTGSFPGVNIGRGVTLIPHRLLMPWSRKSRAIPLLPLSALRPVQNLSACTRVHFYIGLRILNTCLDQQWICRNALFKPVNRALVWPKAVRVFTLNDIHYFAVEVEKLLRLSPGGLWKLFSITLIYCLFKCIASIRPHC